MFSPYIPYAERRVMSDVMKLGHYVIVDNSSNYVTFHELNVCIKVKK